MAYPVSPATMGESRWAENSRPSELRKMNVVCLPEPLPHISRPVMPTINNVIAIQNPVARRAASCRLSHGEASQPLKLALR